MAWDFSTEPEFEAQLAWMREFLETEIKPIEVLGLKRDQMLTFIKPLQEEVKNSKKQGTANPPDLRLNMPDNPGIMLCTPLTPLSIARMSRKWFRPICKAVVHARN